MVGAVRTHGRAVTRSHDAAAERASETVSREYAENDKAASVHEVSQVVAKGDPIQIVAVRPREDAVVGRHQLDGSG